MVSVVLNFHVMLYQCLLVTLTIMTHMYKRQEIYYSKIKKWEILADADTGNKTRTICVLFI